MRWARVALAHCIFSAPAKRHALSPNGNGALHFPRFQQCVMLWARMIMAHCTFLGSSNASGPWSWDREPSSRHGSGGRERFPRDREPNSRYGPGRRANASTKIERQRANTLHWKWICKKSFASRNPWIAFIRRQQVFTVPNTSSGWVRYIQSQISIPSPK